MIRKTNPKGALEPSKAPFFCARPYGPTLLVLLGHGVRCARLGSLRTVARRVGQLTGLPCLAAYLAHEKPSLEACLVEAYAAGHRSALVVPLFLSKGRHLREDVPLAVHRVRRLLKGMRLSLATHLGAGHGVALLTASKVQGLLGNPMPPHPKKRAAARSTGRRP